MNRQDTATKNLPLHIIGLGGIGARLMEPLAKEFLSLQKHLSEKAKTALKIEIYLWDPDRFETKNFARQFTQFKWNPVGEPKVSLAVNIFREAWEAAHPDEERPVIHRMPKEFAPELMEDDPNQSMFQIALCGVDNGLARREILKWTDKEKALTIFGCNEVREADAFVSCPSVAPRMDPRRFAENSFKAPKASCTDAPDQTVTANMTAAAFMLNLLQRWAPLYVEKKRRLKTEKDSNEGLTVFFPCHIQSGAEGTSTDSELVNVPYTDKLH